MKIIHNLLLPGLLVLTVSTLAACMHGRPAEVPLSATLVAEGDRATAFTATQNGTVYVYDADEDRIAYTGRVSPNQTLNVDREHDKITLNGTTVSEKGLKSNNIYRIYFLPGLSPM